MGTYGPTLTIKEFDPSDLPRLHEIRSAAFAPVFASLRAILGEAIAPRAFGDGEAEQGRHFEELCAGSGDIRVYVAVIGETIAGFVSVILDRAKLVGELGLNAVDPAFAGQGLGTKMYGFALERMREAGMQVAVVGTGGDPSHAPARSAYEKAGFDRALETVWLYREL